MVTCKQIRKGSSDSNEGNGLNTFPNSSNATKVDCRFSNHEGHEANYNECYYETNPSVTPMSGRNDAEQDAPGDSNELVESFPSSNFVNHAKCINSRSEDNCLFELLTPRRAGDLLVVLEDLCLSFHLSVFFSPLKEHYALVAPCELNIFLGPGVKQGQNELVLLRTVNHRKIDFHQTLRMTTGEVYLLFILHYSKVAFLS